MNTKVNFTIALLLSHFIFNVFGYVQQPYYDSHNTNVDYTPTSMTEWKQNYKFDLPYDYVPRYMFLYEQKAFLMVGRYSREQKCYFYEINPKTGDLLQRHLLDIQRCDYHVDIVVLKDMMFITDQGNESDLHAINITNFKPLWKQKVAQNYFNPKVPTYDSQIGAIDSTNAVSLSSSHKAIPTYIYNPPESKPVFEEILPGMIIHAFKDSFYFDYREPWGSGTKITGVNTKTLKKTIFLIDAGYEYGYNSIMSKATEELIMLQTSHESTRLYFAYYDLNGNLKTRKLVVVGSEKFDMYDRNLFIFDGEDNFFLNTISKSFQQVLYILDKNGIIKKQYPIPFSFTKISYLKKKLIYFGATTRIFDIEKGEVVQEIITENFVIKPFYLVNAHEGYLFSCQYSGGVNAKKCQNIKINL